MLDTDRINHGLVGDSQILGTFWAVLFFFGRRDIKLDEEVHLTPNLICISKAPPPATHPPAKENWAQWPQKKKKQTNKQNNVAAENGQSPRSSQHLLKPGPTRSAKNAADTTTLTWLTFNNVCGLKTHVCQRRLLLPVVPNLPDRGL